VHYANFVQQSLLIAAKHVISLRSSCTVDCNEFLRGLAAMFSAA